MLLNDLTNELQDAIKGHLMFKPKTKNELQEAVNLWCTNKEEATIKHGHISNWNTSLITDMTGLFYDKETSINDTLSDIETLLLEKKLMTKGDIYITTSSMPKHWDGHANMIKINEV